MEPSGDLACLGRARAWSFGELVLGLQSSCQEARSLGFSLCGGLGKRKGTLGTSAWGQIVASLAVLRFYLISAAAPACSVCQIKAEAAGAASAAEGGSELVWRPHVGGVPPAALAVPFSGFCYLYFYFIFLDFFIFL